MAATWADGAMNDQPIATRTSEATAAIATNGAVRTGVVGGSSWAWTALAPSHRAIDGPTAGALAATTRNAAIGRKRTAPSAANVHAAAASSRNGSRPRRGRAAASRTTLA